MQKKESFEYETRSDIKGLADSILQVKKVFDEHDLFFWISYGGLLGIIRDGELIPWNNDLEAGCWYSDISDDQITKIVDRLNNIGFTCIFYKSFGTINIKKGPLVDININFYWIENEKVIRPHETASKYEGKNFFASVFYWISAFLFIYPNSFKKFKFRNKNELLNLKNIFKFLISQISKILPLNIRRKVFELLISISEKLGGKFQKTAMPLEYFENFELYPFNGSQIYIPSNPEKLLKFLYGNDWKIPKDKWRFYDEENKKNTSIEFINEKFDYSKLNLK